MIPVQIGVSDASLVVSAYQGTWRTRVANSMAIAPGKRGEVIVAMGDDAARAAERVDVRVIRPFDAEAFDPDAAASATRHWSWRAMSRDGTRPFIRMLFARAVVDLVWSAWSRIPAEKRRIYLNDVGWSMDITVNGRPAVESRASGRFLGRPPRVTP